MEKIDCDKKTGCSSCATADQCDDKTKKEHQDLQLYETLSAIKHKILVLGGKGGVGKSTIAANLAATLSARGYETGILDIDIHGPNIAKMLGFEGVSFSGDDKGEKILPFQVFPHLKAISMAGLIPNSDEPIVWRGPLKMAVIRQLIEDVAWGALDFLIVDSPPGTGDEPLSIAQLIPNADGAVIVTSPQEVALLDSRKCINFTKKLNLPVLGVIENMSGLQCPHCHELIPLFGQGGGKTAAQEFNVPFLGSLPMDPDMPELCDRGHPHMLLEDESKFKEAFTEVVDQLVNKLDL